MTARLSLGLMVAAAGLLGQVSQVKLPPYSRQVLPNGVVVDLMARPGVPLVGFRILVKGGGESDPADRAGLASVTAQLLRKGTSKRSADQFSEELDFLGGTFQAGEGFGISSATTISAEFLKKDFDRGLALLQRAMEMHRAGAGGVDSVAVADDYSRMAEIDTDRHRPVDAVGALNMAIAIHSKLTGPLDPSVVPDLDRLGPVYISLGEYDNAEWIFRQALLIRESVYGNKNPDLIATVDGLAYALFGEKKYDEADPLYQRLLGLWVDSVGEKHAMVAMALDKIAVFYTEQKKFQQAKDASDRANAIRSYGLAMGLGTEAARLQPTNPDEARDLYRRALRALDPPNPIYDELHAKLAANLELLKPGKPAAKTGEKTAR